MRLAAPTNPPSYDQFELDYTAYILRRAQSASNLVVSVLQTPLEPGPIVDHPSTARRLLVLDNVITQAWDFARRAVSSSFKLGNGGVPAALPLGLADAIRAVNDLAPSLAISQGYFRGLYTTGMVPAPDRDMFQMVPKTTRWASELAGRLGHALAEVEKLQDQTHS